jgi:Flp pilus assembly protein TadD
LGTLSPAQNKVITELAYFWEATKVENLIPKCKMDGKTISALLNQLSKLSYVEKIKGKTKNLLYRVEERFFNLWLIMTQGGPQQKLEAKYLTDFLETWYDRNELDQLCQEFTEEIKTKTEKRGELLSMSHALLNAKSLDRKSKIALYSKLKKELHFSERDIGRADIYFGNLDEEISKAFKEKRYHELIDFLEVAEVEEDKKYYSLGIAYQELLDFSESEQNYLKALKKGYDKALFNLAILYERQGKFKEAEKYYLFAIEKGDGIAANNLALLYQSQEKWKEAEKYYLFAIKNGDELAILNLALMYDSIEELKEAEKYYLLAIENGVEDAFNNLAILYNNQERWAEAEKYYQLAIKNGVDEAFNNLAILYDDQGKWVEAEKYFLLAIEKGIDDAIFNLGLLYKLQKRWEEAEKFYLLAIEKGMVIAEFNLAILYEDQKRWEEAEKYYLSAIKSGVITASHNLALLYQEQGRWKDAESYYLLAIENGVIRSMQNLMYFYYERKEKESLYKILKEYGKYSGEINLEMLTILYLYVGKMEKFKFNFDKVTYVDNIEKISSDFITHLLIHQQFELIIQLFRDNEILKEKYKPLYYATILLKEPHGATFLKIPPELKENINDILRVIKEGHLKYYPSNVN